MNEREKGVLIDALGKIPCELSIATNHEGGCAWLGCRECSRCIVLHALHSDKPFENIESEMAGRPSNGGYTLRPELISKKSSG